MISDIRVGSPDSDRGPPTAIPEEMRSPNPYEIERSPSAASMYSVGGTRKGFNFSRPTLSNKPSVDSLHRPTIEIPSRNLPQDHEEAVQTPTSPGEGGEEPAQTYLYAKFDLPRGRALGRNSAIFQDPAGVEQNPANALSSAPGQNDMLAPPQRSQSSSVPNSPRLPPDNSTLKPNAAAAAAAVALPPKSPHVPPSPAASIAPDEHLKMGIDLHEKGSLNESTYHLRCAARGGHPTGMLLYALACRHGWGMRPNQREGVEWLKKVTQLASSEVADDENGISNMPFMEKQGRRNQFALSIYELGVSHLNGWGTEMDKGLALNCFEIAGSKWAHLCVLYALLLIIPQNGEIQMRSLRPAFATQTASARRRI
jgi:TPR repeat protein